MKRRTSVVHNFDKEDKFITAVFSALPIILAGIGSALLLWRGPWEGEWTLPRISLFTGGFGWMVILAGVLLPYTSNNGPEIFAESKLSIYGGGILGFLLGLLMAHVAGRDPYIALIFALIGSFWSFALCQLNKPGGKYGIGLSVLVAFISWLVIALYFSGAKYSVSVLSGIVGIVFVGYIGGIIAPVVHYIRHADIKIPWI